ncbi:MAG: hypothetical protein VYC11_03890 [Candidatus Thermoplasmatota archaeon]|nr:hypothetical protein [Candidatus Thermoplasmatota archaeon]MEC9090494.1 hypothetical protein [Candidatus Thermoplasmatota archaeon]MED5486349.1 hypothetical protein [Candidatus Thermoplasmatota archaeon]
MANFEETLTLRQETHGKSYPNWLEKIGFVVALSLSIYCGYWLWQKSDLPDIILWFSTFCLLPIFTLLLGETIARMIHFSQKS